MALPNFIVLAQNKNCVLAQNKYRYISTYLPTLLAPKKNLLLLFAVQDLLRCLGDTDFNRTIFMVFKPFNLLILFLLSEMRVWIRSRKTSLRNVNKKCLTNIRRKMQRFWKENKGASQFEQKRPWSLARRWWRAKVEQ